MGPFMEVVGIGWDSWLCMEIEEVGCKIKNHYKTDTTKGGEIFKKKKKKRRNTAWDTCEIFQIETTLQPEAPVIFLLSTSPPFLNAL